MQLPAYMPPAAFGSADYWRWCIVFAQGVCILKLASIALFEFVLPLARTYPPRILADVGEAAAFAAWTLLWMNANGVDATGILTTSAILTAVIGLSFQDTLGNIISGLAIQLDQSINVGDWVRVDGVEGKVSEIRWRYTAMETRNWETVLIPNSFMAKNKFMLLGRRQGQPQQWRRWIWFNVDFRFHPSKVIEHVQTAMDRTEIPRVAKDPKPNCLFMEFHESYGRYALRYWLDALDADDPTDSAVREHVYFALERAGIPLSIPAHAVFLTKETADRKERKAAKSLQQRQQFLKGLELFKDLTPQELDELASHIVAAPFLTGDLITRQGTEGTWLYMIVEGKAEVVVKNQSGFSETLGELHEGDIFGEIALMTGERRTATVIARSEMSCFRLDKESFRGILRARPELASKMSEVLARRKLGVESALHHLDEADQSKRINETHQDILTKIRALFHLN
jgi:CRP-like cAMP-binding protein